METILINVNTAQKRYETLEGKQYLVVPMVMLTEGVHSGSGGALFYPKEELRKTPVVWNHKPLVVYHPQRNGQGVSACLPEVLESRKVGIVMNSKFDGNLKAEAWFDEAKLKKVDKRVLDAINNGEMMEVSTGLFTDNEKMDGIWNGEEYTAIARNYRPDHLAILPDQKGACSIDDGAGLLRNAKAVLGKRTAVQEDEQEILVNYSNRWPKSKRDKLNSKDFAGPNESFPIKTQKDVESAAHLAGHANNPDAVRKRIRQIAKRKGLKVPKSLSTNAAKTPPTVSFSHGAIRRALGDALRSSVETVHGVRTGGGYVEDVYDDFFIGSRYEDGKEKTFKQGYQIKTAGKGTGNQPIQAKLVGVPTEVKKVTAWHDLQGNLVANSKADEVLENTRDEVKQHFIDELRNAGFKTRGELTMLQRKSVDDLALLVQKVHMGTLSALTKNQGSGAGLASAASVAAPPPASGKTFAQPKGKTKPVKKRKKKKQKEEEEIY